MSDPLAIYLHDHLAGSTLAVELLETLRKNYPDHETGKFAATLLAEVLRDKSVLAGIIDDVGDVNVGLKDASAWLAEKASRWKLRHADPTGLGAFEAFEALSLGIAGKRAMWTALSAIAMDDTRLAGHDFGALTARAQSQFDRAEAYRLRLVKTALKPTV